MPPKPPVSAWPRVNVLKTVVLPDPASPTIAICTPRCYRPGCRRGSVPGAGVDEIDQLLAGGEQPEVVAEELDAAIEDAAGGPGRVGRHDDVRQVVERRGRRQRLLAERVEDRATDAALAQGAQ